MCQTRRPAGHVQPYGIHFWQSEMWLIQRQYILTCRLFAVETNSPCEKEALTHRSYPFFIVMTADVKDKRNKGKKLEHPVLFFFFLLGTAFKMIQHAV